MSLLISLSRQSGWISRFPCENTASEVLVKVMHTDTEATQPRGALSLLSHRAIVQGCTSLRGSMGHIRYISKQKHWKQRQSREKLHKGTFYHGMLLTFLVNWSLSERFLKWDHMRKKWAWSWNVSFSLTDRNSVGTCFLFTPNCTYSALIIHRPHARTRCLQLSFLSLLPAVITLISLSRYQRVIFQQSNQPSFYHSKTSGVLVASRSIEIASLNTPSHHYFESSASVNWCSEKNISNVFVEHIQRILMLPDKDNNQFLC